MFYRLFGVKGMSVTMLRNSQFLEHTLDRKYPNSKKGVSPTTTIEALLFFGGMAILSWSITGKKVSASRTTQKGSLGGIVV